MFSDWFGLRIFPFKPYQSGEPGKCKERQCGERKMKGNENVWKGKLIIVRGKFSQGVYLITKNKKVIYSYISAAIRCKQCEQRIRMQETNRKVSQSH